MFSATRSGVSSSFRRRATGLPSITLAVLSSEHPVLPAQTHLGPGEIHLQELGVHHRRLLRHQIVRQGMRESWSLECKRLNRQGIDAAEQPVRTRPKNPLEVAVAQQQAGLVLVHHRAFEQHDRAPV